MPGGAALQGRPGQLAGAARPRPLKLLLNAVATVRTHPADRAKYVYLQRQFCVEQPRSASQGDRAESETHRPQTVQSGPGKVAPELACDVDPPALMRRQPQSIRVWRMDWRRDRPPAAREDLEPQTRGVAEADGVTPPGAPAPREPGLLAKRDFITGFTCLHWAAKHHRQELLAMLVSFANKHQLPVNINARSSAGYTALHLAAMHGHVEVKFLVGTYDANVDIWDYSGKKGSQYLSQSTAEEIKSLVWALDEEDAESAARSGGVDAGGCPKCSPHLITYRLSKVLEDGGTTTTTTTSLKGGLEAKRKKQVAKPLAALVGRSNPGSTKSTSEPSSDLGQAPPRAEEHRDADSKVSPEKQRQRTVPYSRVCLCWEKTQFGRIRTDQGPAREKGQRPCHEA
ncbi:Ankyrin repeat domain-containing protein 57 [Tupaia chinensis]|uniref:Ankyrin repeat domain-containing protein 57 n=1 Tax=Tupaia chinensis TaxID=246437 RepID=L9KR31_TUPCH|nr:Ankyrin repeat domain-containing protein 57 [Tupaia chinensis]